MASLDNLVVSTALPVIRVHLHAGLSGLEWTVNAYTLTFAVLLLSAAAMGERFGRRRIFVLGIAVFTARLGRWPRWPRPSGCWSTARAVQGAGGAMIMPLSLTLLSAAVPPERRNAALGIWGAIGGAAVALGPLVGGAVTSGWSWQYIFWLNVPVGRGAGPAGLVEAVRVPGRPVPPRPGRRGAGQRRACSAWSSAWSGATPTDGPAPRCSASFVVGAVALAGFVAWELRSDHPMLDIRLFRHRGFASVNVTALLFSFGMFGSIFFLTQFLQTVQGSPRWPPGSGCCPGRPCPCCWPRWWAMLAERWGGKPLVVTGPGLPGHRTGLAGLGHAHRPRPTSTWWLRS